MTDRPLPSRQTRKYKIPAAQARRIGMVASVAIGIAVSVYLILGRTIDVDQQVLANVKVYKNPSCGCCDKWVEHLEHSGFEVDVVNRSDVVVHKRKLGVPEQFFSCHTAEVGGYVIEGHVPAKDIKKLLVEKPAYRGLAVPGMPQGSPGMETGRIDDYNVFVFDAGKPGKVFSHYPDKNADRSDMAPDS